jgi:hypothetical protein
MYLKGSAQRCNNQKIGVLMMEIMTLMYYRLTVERLVN